MLEKFFGEFPKRQTLQWIILLLAVWFMLNAMDMFTTYLGLSGGNCHEGNPFMAIFIRVPGLAIAVKMVLALIGARIIERLAERNEKLALSALLLVDLFMVYICGSNLIVVAAG